MRNFYTKSLLTLLLSLCCAVVSAQSFESNGISYSILSLSDRTVEVAHNANYQGFIIIPSTTDYSGISFKVTGIGNSAFSGTNVTEMIISEGVTYIGNSAFQGSTLKEIIIPNCVTSIGDYAFSYCTGLTSVTIGNSVTEIGAQAFYRCTNLTSITIPNSVTTIGSYTFYNCTSLTSVTIGNGVTSIEEKAFYGCTKLKLIYNDSSLNLTIGSNEYGYVAYYAKFITTNKNDYTIVDDYIFNKTDGVYTLVSYIGSDIKISLPLNCNGINYAIGSGAFRDCTYLTSITIPNSVTSIGYQAFYGCSGLTSIEIPNSVTSIGGRAFFYCTGLTSIEIPNSVTSIGDNAFSGCTGLTAIHITNLSAWCNIDFSNDNSNPLFNAKNLYINGEKVSSLVIPSGITEIKQYAFRDCTNLTSITIPNSVTTIGYRAFYGCKGLTSITIPNSVTSIGSGAFDGCKGLTSITIPNSVTTIGDWAFDGCSGLTSITIPNSVTSIGYYAFSHCSGLTSITIPNSVTTIGSYAFNGCTGLTSITIPNSVKSIGESAFSGCSGLTSIKVGSGNTRYDSRDNCNAIIETATNTLIQGCKNTIIPNSVTSIGDSAFSICTGLTSITIGNSVTTIGDYAFYYCTGLTSITIGNSVTTIGDYAFSNCSGLTEMYVKANTPPSADYYTFYNVPKTIPVYVPTGTKAAYQAAAYWKNFTNIVEMTIAGDVDGDNIVDIADVTTLAEIILNGEKTEEGPTEQTFDAWTSTNAGVSNSTSQNSYTLEATEGSVLTFDWSVSSETNYDWLIVTLDGTQILKKSGNDSGSYTHTFTTAGTHTLVVKYTKDGSRNSGSDKGGIYNIKLSGSANNKTNPAADVDGDGSIDVADITSLVNIILGTTEE